MLLLPATTSRTPLLDVIHNVDCMRLLRALPDKCANCVVTSPPYFGLRDYGVKGQIGLEPTPAQFVQTMVAVFREVRRVLRDDGTVWLNFGDSYASGEVGRHDQKSGHWISGHSSVKGNGEPRQYSRPDTGLPPKNLIGIPWRVAFGLQDDGWILRSDIIWHKPNPMPESVTDRPTKAHEYVFLLSKRQSYWYDSEAIREDFADERNGDPGKYNRTSQAAKGANRDRQDTGFLNNGAGWTHGLELGGRNRRSVWTVTPEPTPLAHFATFPTKLIEPMILAGCPAGGLVLDPFMGSGTTAIVARKLGRHYLGCDLNPAYVALAKDRLRLPFEEPMVKRETRFDDLPLFAESYRYVLTTEILER